MMSQPPEVHEPPYAQIGRRPREPARELNGLPKQRLACRGVSLPQMRERQLVHRFHDLRAALATMAAAQLQRLEERRLCARVLAGRAQHASDALERRRNQMRRRTQSAAQRKRVAKGFFGADVLASLFLEVGQVVERLGERQTVRTGRLTPQLHRALERAASRFGQRQVPVEATDDAVHGGLRVGIIGELDGDTFGAAVEELAGGDRTTLYSPGLGEFEEVGHER
jgi:hypothetical protein